MFGKMLSDRLKIILAEFLCGFARLSHLGVFVFASQLQQSIQHSGSGNAAILQHCPSPLTDFDAHWVNAAQQPFISTFRIGDFFGGNICRTG